MVTALYTRSYATSNPGFYPLSMKKDLISQADVADRIRYLIRQSRMTQAQFAARLSVNPSNLSKHLSGKIPISEGLINKIVVDMGVSKAWLRDGEDIPYPRPMHAAEIEIERPTGILTEDVRRGVPVYDIDVTAGHSELSRMFTADRIMGYMDLPSLNPDCIIVRVSGDSMEPVIDNGSFVAIRPVSTSGIIFWGQIYIIVTEDYRMVKYLRRHTDSDYVVLHSANPAYDDIDIPRSAIEGLFLVETILNYNRRY